MNGNCSHGDDVNAFIAGELSSAETRSFEAHLPACPACRTAVDDSQRVVSFLVTAPPPQPRADMAEGILQKIRAENAGQFHRRSRWPRIAAPLAAAAAIAIGVFVFFNGEQGGVAEAPPLVASANTASISRALDWFSRHQEPDGSWDAEKWGGNRRFQVALTALPLIALLENDCTPEQDAAAQRAVAFVRGQQRGDGSFSEDFREAPYIQSVSTLALLRAQQRQPSSELRNALDSALRIVLSTQTPDGAWGYRLSHAPNLSITLWHKNVVELATAMGWKEARPSLERVNRWLASNQAEAVDHPGIEQDSGTDYHRAYFAVATLRSQSTAEAREKIAAIRHDLISAQAAGGDVSGTWSPTDQWSRAGGRIYSTALASLTLR